MLPKRTRGRPATNPTSIHLTLAPGPLAEVDRWIERQKVPPSRPEAIRRLVEIGLKARNDCVMPRIRWTLEEDERLLGLIAAGKSWTFISAALRRDTNSVKLHAGTLRARQEERTATRRAGAGGEGEMRAERLQELEAMAAKLLETARKLPPGSDRQSIL